MSDGTNTPVEELEPPPECWTDTASALKCSTDGEHISGVTHNNPELTPPIAAGTMNTDLCHRDSKRVQSPVIKSDIAFRAEVTCGVFAR